MTHTPQVCKLRHGLCGRSRSSPSARPRLKSRGVLKGSKSSTRGAAFVSENSRDSLRSKDDKPKKTGLYDFWIINSDSWHNSNPTWLLIDVFLNFNYQTVWRFGTPNLIHINIQYDFSSCLFLVMLNVLIQTSLSALFKLQILPKVTWRSLSWNRQVKILQSTWMKISKLSNWKTSCTTFRYYATLVKERAIHYIRIYIYICEELVYICILYTYV